MRPLNKLEFDADERQVTVGGGVITDNFVKYLESVGMEVSKYLVDAEYRISKMAC